MALRKDTLTQSDQDHLNELLELEVEELRQDQIADLRARRDYLTKLELDKFAEILEDKPAKKDNKAKDEELEAVEA